MEGVSGSSSVGTAALDAMKKSMNVQEKQMKDLLDGATEANKKTEESSRIAANSTGLGVNLNIKG
ncbi:MAG: hypothetical protein PHE67_08220 [Campylobacterales bacterium]|nr:hypothetical protein [Campylobacterales bacterium]